MPRKYKGHVGHSAGNDEKSLCNYFVPRNRKFRRESLARDASWECWVVYSDEGLTLETSVFESFTVANLPYRPCG